MFNKSSYLNYFNYNSITSVRGNDITFLQRLSPTESPRVYLHIDIATLHQYTHIVIHVSATDNPVCSLFLHIISLYTVTWFTGAHGVVVFMYQI